MATFWDTMYKGQVAQVSLGHIICSCTFYSPSIGVKALTLTSEKLIFSLSITTFLKERALLSICQISDGSSLPVIVFIDQYVQHAYVFILSVVCVLSRITECTYRLVKRKPTALLKNVSNVFSLHRKQTVSFFVACDLYFASSFSLKLF